MAIWYNVTPLRKVLFAEFCRRVRSILSYRLTLKFAIPLNIRRIADMSLCLPSKKKPKSWYLFLYKRNLFNWTWSTLKVYIFKEHCMKNCVKKHENLWDENFEGSFRWWMWSQNRRWEKSMECWTLFPQHCIRAFLKTKSILRPLPFNL